MNYPLLQLLSAFIGSLGFALAFNLRLKYLLPAAIGGLFTWGIYLLTADNGIFIACLIAALFADLYSQISARIIKAPVTLFVIPCIIPLVPGSSLYYTLYYAVNGNYNEFVKYGLITITFVFGIAFGIGISSGIFSLIAKIQNRTKK